MQSVKTNKLAIANAFSAAAKTYDQAAIIEKEIGERLLDRLADLPQNPRYILDLGCGTGYFTARLQELFPDAIIIGLDFAYGMVNFASHNTIGKYCCADAESLPFSNMQFDLIFTNCCLPSINNLPKLFVELQRVLAVNGLLFFSTFGPETLVALGLENTWLDMHFVGDILLSQNYKNPVVDMEYITIAYDALKDLCLDLQQSGTFKIDMAQIADLHVRCEAKYEVIYGVAIKDAKSKQSKDEFGNVYVSVDEIKYL